MSSVVVGFVHAIRKRSQSHSQYIFVLVIVTPPLGRLLSNILACCHVRAKVYKVLYM